MPGEHKLPIEIIKGGDDLPTVILRPVVRDGITKFEPVQE